MTSAPWPPLRCAHFALHLALLLAAGAEPFARGAGHPEDALAPWLRLLPNVLALGEGPAVRSALRRLRSADPNKPVPPRDAGSDSSSKPEKVSGEEV